MTDSNLIHELPPTLVAALTPELEAGTRARLLVEVKNKYKSSNDDLFRAVLHILISQTTYMNSLGEFIASCDLVSEIEEYLEEAANLSTRASNVNVVKRNLDMTKKLCFALEYVYETSSLGGYTVELLFDRASTLVQPTGKFYSSIKRFNTSFRIFSRILAEHHKTPDFALNGRFVPGGTNRTSVLGRGGDVYAKHGIQLNSVLAKKKYPFWFASFNEWLEGTIKKDTKSSHMAFTHFIAHLEKNGYGDSPTNYLSRRQKPNFWHDLAEYPASTSSKADWISQIVSFTSWMVDEWLVPEDVSDSKGTYIFTASELNAIRLQCPTNRLPESNKEVLPTLWLHKCKDILTQDNYAWPKSLSLHYFTWRKPESDQTERVWVPTITYLILLMMEIPIRKIQAQLLDSGEGDIERYNRINKSWERNEGPHSGHWKKLKTRRDSRGAITKLISEGKPMAGFYINTNKTQDIKVGFDETAGYNIPWENEAAIALLDELRTWQEKYNPASSALPYKDIPHSIFGGKPSKTALQRMPDRFYLFRNPGAMDTQSPISDNSIYKFWHRLMEELERRLREEGEDVTITLSRSTKGVPGSSLFTPHGLRVSGLTSLAEQGVPIEVLSKIVAGHASILMTLHYIKYNTAHITELLNNARYQADLNAQDQFVKRLNSASYNEAKEFAVANSKEALFIVSDRSEKGITSSYFGSTLGVCPHGGTACNTGGPVIRRAGGAKDAYGPVPGGEGNCPRCRYFITGAPWLINLWLEGNKAFTDAHKLVIQLDSLRSDKALKDKERYAYIKSGDSASIPRELVKDIHLLDAGITNKSHELDNLLMNAHAIHNLMEQVREAIGSHQNENDHGTPIIIASDAIGPTTYNETSRFEALDTIVQTGRIWRHVEDPDIERERDNFIDHILFNSGIKPIAFTPLSSEEKKMASDSASKFLLTSLSMKEIGMLEQGIETLETLGLASELKSQIVALEPSSLLNVPTNSKQPALEITHE